MMCAVAVRAAAILVSLLCLGGLFLCGQARADPFHHQAFPLGERALGMGGAFTGLANEPSAAYYNPAGLVRLDDTSLSAGLTLNAFDRLTIQDGFRTANGSAVLQHEARPSLPLFVSLVKQLGPRDERRRRHHAVALSTFTVDQRRLEFDAKIQRSMPDGRTIVDTVSVTDDQVVRWQGGSYAYRVSPELSIGLSLFYSVSRMSHAEERMHLTVDGPPEAGAQPTLRLDSRRASHQVWNAVGRLGIMYAVPRYRVGLMVQPPSVHLLGRAKVRDRVVLADALETMSTGSFTEASDRNVRAEEPFPWEVRVGFAYIPTSDFTLSFDGAFYGPDGSAEEPVRAISGRNFVASADRAARVGAFGLDQWRRNMVGNAALGTEYVVYDAIVIRAGVYSDLSAAPALPRTSSFYRPNNIHRFGASLSVGIVTAGYDVSLGGVARFGWGHALAMVGEEPTTSYRRTRAEEQTMFVFLTGARRAVSRLARATVDRYFESRSPPTVTEPEPTPLPEPPAELEPKPAVKKRRRE